MRKSAAALLLRAAHRRAVRRHRHRRLGEGHLGAAAHPPVEGRVERGFQGLDVGDKVRVELISVDVERGFIDFRGLGVGSGSRRGRAHSGVH